MNRFGFGARSTGMPVGTFGKRQVFPPCRLPPDGLDLNPLAMQIAEASQAIGELKGIDRTVPNPALLIRPLQRREAVSSSGMEGIRTCSGVTASASRPPGDPR